MRRGPRFSMIALSALLGGGAPTPVAADGKGIMRQTARVMPTIPAKSLEKALSGSVAGAVDRR